VSASEYPRIVVVSATPIEGEWATSDLMRSLFANWPPDRLSQIVLERDGVDPASQPIPTSALALDGGRNPLAILRQLETARSFCDDVEAEVVYFRSAGWPLAFEAVPLWLSRRSDLALVTHLMDDWPARLAHTRPRVAALAEPMLRATLRASDECLAISSPMAAHFGSVASRRFGVVHNGVPSDVVLSDNHDHVAPNEPMRIVYSGSAAPDQSAAALVDAVRAVEQLIDRGLDVQLDLALSPRHADAMRTHVAESTAVRVLGFADPPAYRERLRTADVLLMAFNFDPTSVAMLRLSMANKVGDYLAARRPIVVYGPGALTTVASAKSLGWGHVIDRHGASRLADGLATLLTDVSRQQALIAAGDQAARTAFDLAAQRQMLAEAIRSAARSNR